MVFQTHASVRWLQNIRITAAFIQKHKVTCLESRYKAVPVFSLLCHIGDAPVHWHEETFSCGDIHTIGDEVSFSTIGFLEIVLHTFAQNNDLVRIFHSVLFALVDKLRTKS